MTNARKSGSRPFSPIYKNFQNLLDHNQGIFRLFRKTKNPGMYQAVWQARQGAPLPIVDPLLLPGRLIKIGANDRNGQGEHDQPVWRRHAPRPLSFSR